MDGKKSSRHKSCSSSEETRVNLLCFSPLSEDEFSALNTELDDTNRNLALSAILAKESKTNDLTRFSIS